MDVRLARTEAERRRNPHQGCRVIKTRLTEEEFAEFSERVTLCKMSQSEFIRQALTKSRICPVITVSPINDELLFAVGKLTAEYGKIGGNLNQIARCLNEYYYYLRYILEMMPRHMEDTDRGFLDSMMPWSEEYREYEQQHTLLCQPELLPNEYSTPPKTPRKYQAA